MLPSVEVYERIKAGTLDAVHLIRNDFEFYAATALKITTKLGQLTNLRFNRCQKILHDIAEKQLAERGMVRIILLKFRQFGGSTYIGGRIFHKTSTRPFLNSKVVAHTKEAVTMLFGMQKRFFNNLDTAIKPMKKYNTKEDLTFLNPTDDSQEFSTNPGLDSQVGVYSAKTSGAGRGGTIQMLHISELPFWFPTQKGKTEEAMLGLMNSVAKGNESEVWIESTARGIGDYFYREYHKAKRGEGDFIAVFLPWYLMEEYSSNVPATFEPSADEKKLMNTEHKDWEYVNPATGKKTLSAGQVMWRRWCIAEQCAGDLSRFRQEYPSTDTEAFLTSGTPFFNLEDVHERLQVVNGMEAPLFKGTIDLLDNQKDVHKAAKIMPTRKIRLSKSEYGDVTIWENPKPDERYVFFSDVSEGVRDGDYSVMYVFSRNTGKMVAKYRGHIDPDEYSFMIYELAHYYNWAYGTPETNNYGFTTTTTLKNLSYPGLHERMQTDKFSPSGTKKAGWMTNQANRLDMLDRLKQFFRDDIIQVMDPELLLEMSTLVRNPNTGKYEAQEGCYDDCVMAAAGACMMFMEIKSGKPRMLGYVEEDGKRPKRRRQRSVVYGEEEHNQDEFNAVIENNLPWLDKEGM